MRWMDGKRTLARLGLVAGLVGIELYLAHDITASGAVMGYTLTKSFTIAPQRRAKVKTVAVQLGANVVAGAVIAELDPTDIDNELAAAKADRDRSIAAIQAQIAKLRRENVDFGRKFELGAERANAQLVTSEAASHTAAAELAAVELELKDQQDLVAKHLANISVVNDLQLRRAALAKQVDTAQHVLSVLRGNATAATQRNTVVEPADGVDSVVAPLEAAVRQAELKVDQLEREKLGFVLHAPVDGVVDQLPLHPGDLAGPDLPVATVVAADTRRVVACIPEARASQIEVGFEADLTSAYDHTHGEGEVESLTNEIAPLPQRCQLPGAKAIAMGRVAVVALGAPLPGLPGQTQLVHFAARRKGHARSTPPVTAVPTSAATSQPVDMKVPGTLLGRTRFEPSGLVWMAALERYVIVSDDTGFKDRDDHAPWLFTMTAEGAVDAQPFVVKGIAQLDDLESIAEDRGKLWVLASNSTSKKGKRPVARRQLVRLTVARDGGTVDGAVDLSALLDKAGEATRNALGLPSIDQLDIEAMAAHDGALYLGLKAPVDGDGRAQIWRVGDPDKLLAGDLAGAQLKLWSKLRFSIEADGRQVPGGLADMTFLDATTLVVTSTASGLDPQHQTSVLAVARVAEGEMTPRIVRTFSGLKAEGIAVKGNQLAIAFDRGSDPGQWLTIPVDELHAK